MSDDQEELLTHEDKLRFAKAAKQIVSYVNFLRWSGNFRSGEMLTHPSHKDVILLSATQSGRFSYAVSGDTVFLGVQAFEAAWITAMPFECAHITDRIYLRIHSTAVLSGKVPDLTIGIYVNSPAKLAEMARASHIEFRRVEVRDGVVSGVGGTINNPVDIKTEDVITALKREQKARQKKLDVSRYL